MEVELFPLEIVTILQAPLTTARVITLLILHQVTVLPDRAKRRHLGDFSPCWATFDSVQKWATFGRFLGQNWAIWALFWCQGCEVKLVKIGEFFLLFSVGLEKF